MDRFQAIVFIAGRIRPGSFPRVPGFSYNEEHRKYLYQGRALSLDEFNEVAKKVLDQPEKRFSISVRLIDAPQKAKPAEKATAGKKPEEKPQTP